MCSLFLALTILFLGIYLGSRPKPVELIYIGLALVIFWALKRAGVLEKEPKGYTMEIGREVNVLTGGFFVFFLLIMLLLQWS